MKMQKGLCMELNGEFSIFIGQNGEFIQGTPAENGVVGEECLFYPNQVSAMQKRKSIKPLWAPIAVAIAVALLFLSVLLPEQEAFAYVQVQVNPGVELGLDEKYDVISIRELNPEGLHVIEKLGDWKNQPFEKVLDKVILLSTISTTDEIVITTVSDDMDQTADKAVEKSLMAITAKAVTQNITVKLKEASKTEWRASVEKEVPVGQLVSNELVLKSEQAEVNPVIENNEPPIKVKAKPSAIQPQTTKEENAEKNTVPSDKSSESAVKSEAVLKGKEKEVSSVQEALKENPAVDNSEAAIPDQAKGKKHSDQQGQGKEDQDKDSSIQQEGPVETDGEIDDAVNIPDASSEEGDKSAKTIQPKLKKKPGIVGLQNLNQKNNREQQTSKSTKAIDLSGNSSKSKNKNKKE